MHTMSILAHATVAAQGLEPQRRALDNKIQWEVRRAKIIQAETHCTWDEALRIARMDGNITDFYTDRAQGCHAAKAP